MLQFVFVYLLTLLCVRVIPANETPKETSSRKIDFDLIEKKQDCGTVLAVTKDSIMIVNRGKAPVSYPFHDRLAAGTVQKKAGQSSSYLASDIKVGDLIGVGLVNENRQDFCVDLSICERPGGLIPPGQIVDKKMPWHEWQNAQIAFRDKGIPIPERLIPKTPPPLKETKDPPKK